MGKSQVPRGTTKKSRCKCGRYYYPRLFGSSMKLSDACSVCKPELYTSSKEKKK